jgi:hypothetical protein
MAKWTEKEAAIRALENNGTVDPNDLIEAARAERHPCHNDFTWDIHDAAAERWRDQARALIRKCKFEVRIEEITERVVQYIPSNTEEATFMSVPKLRSKAKVRENMRCELDMLLGLVGRIRGLSIAKQNILGAHVTSTLNTVHDLVKGLRDDIE